MFHFRRRRRLYALLGAGVVAGGCAAYAAYSFGWFSTLAREEDEPEEDPSTDVEKDDVSSSGKGPTSKETTIDQADIDAHVEHHFQSIQTIATETTITNLMAQLAENIKSIDNIEETVEKLRQTKLKQQEKLKVHNGGTGMLSVKQKLSMWNAVLDGAVRRFICVVWTLPMLQLQIRVQLNILGRTLYLQSSLENHAVMISSAQEAFLSIGEYLGTHGCVCMMKKSSEIGNKVVASLKKDGDFLANAVTMKDINGALSSGLEMFEKEMIRTGDWLEAVIPPNEYIDRILSSIDSLEDQQRVMAMWRETVAIMKSPEFSGQFLELCAKRLSGMISDRMEEVLGRELVHSLVRTIPPLVNEVSQALDTSSEYVKTLSSMQEIEDMSARVYANGSL